MRYQRMGLFWPLLAGCLAIFAAVSGSRADQTESKADKIARAMRAAPPAISENAAIVDLDGTVLREGTNGWTCMPGLVPGDDHPMCNDAAWMEWMKAFGSKTAPETDQLGISYMLAGDARVNNADPSDTTEDPGEVWVQEGPHLMILVPDASMLAGVSDDPNSGGPYVMWGDTPYVHIMVPVAPRPD